MSNSKCKTDISQKLIITLWSAMIFLIVSSKFVYSLTNSFGLKTLSSSGLPSNMGYVIHTAVFAILIFISMYISLPSV